MPEDEELKPIPKAGAKSEFRPIHDLLTIHGKPVKRTDATEEEQSIPLLRRRGFLRMSAGLVGAGTTTGVAWHLGWLEGFKRFLPQPKIPEKRLELTIAQLIEQDQKKETFASVIKQYIRQDTQVEFWHRIENWDPESDGAFKTEDITKEVMDPISRRIRTEPTGQKKLIYNLKNRNDQGSDLDLFLIYDPKTSSVERVHLRCFFNNQGQTGENDSGNPLNLSNKDPIINTLQNILISNPESRLWYFHAPDVLRADLPTTAEATRQVRTVYFINKLGYIEIDKLLL